MSHPHGCVNWNFAGLQLRRCPPVASSRVRELKLFHQPVSVHHRRRILTGAWIETFKICNFLILSSRILTGAWIETCQRLVITNLFSRILTGAWIETSPSGSRPQKDTSHPHGCVSWNKNWGDFGIMARVASSRVRELKRAHELGTARRRVASSRVRELKPFYEIIIVNNTRSHPHGCVNWNYPAAVKVCQTPVAPLRVRKSQMKINPHPYKRKNNQYNLIENIFLLYYPTYRLPKNNLQYNKIEIR